MNITVFLFVGLVLAVVLFLFFGFIAPFAISRHYSKPMKLRENIFIGCILGGGFLLMWTIMCLGDN